MTPCPALLAHAQQERVVGDAGGADEDLDGPELGLDLGEAPFDVVGEVTSQRLAMRSRCAGLPASGGRVAAIRDGDPVAGLLEAACAGEADALASRRSRATTRPLTSRRRHHPSG